MAHDVSAFVHQVDVHDAGVVGADEAQQNLRHRERADSVDELVETIPASLMAGIKNIAPAEDA